MSIHFLSAEELAESAYTEVRLQTRGTMRPPDDLAVLMLAYLECMRYHLINHEIRVAILERAGIPISSISCTLD